MATGIVGLALALAVAPGGETTAARVHQEVRAIMAAHEGRALFSELYNREDLPAAEREYAARLYEVFFALPAYLAAEQRAEGRPPRLDEIAGNFGLPREAAALLVEIAVTDPRLPSLLRRDGASGEIVTLDLAALDAFAAQKGASVAVSGWAGRPLPDLALTGLDGEPLGSAALAGRPALVFLWLTRCPVCRRVTPDVVALDRRFRERGLRVVGLCADEALGLDVPDAERRAWLGEQGVEYRNALLDAGARTALGNQNIFPAFFLVRADGVVERLLINAQEPEALAALVEGLLQ